LLAKELAQDGPNDSRHRQICAEMLERFGHTTDADTAATVVWLATLLPNSVKDADQLVSLGELAVKAKPDNAGYLETLGAGYYRAGNFQAAVKTLDEAVTKQGEGGSAAMQFFLAMVHHQLKNEAKTKEYL